MPREPAGEQRVKIRVSLPASLVLSVDHQLIDPDTGKPRHGARSRLIESFLREWLNRMSPPGKAIGHSPND